MVSFNYCFLGKPSGDFRDNDIVMMKTYVQKASLLTREFKFRQWVLGVD